MISTMDSVVAYLKEITRFKQQREPPRGMMFFCIEDFVLTYGREFPFAVLPAGVRKRRLGRCFSNAWQLVESNPGKYIYVEGFALSIIPMEHAWCIDRQGNIIDPTWHDGRGSQYFGVPFKSDFVRATILERERYGVLTNWEHGYPLLRGADPAVFLEEAIRAHGLERRTKNS